MEIEQNSPLLRKTDHIMEIIKELKFFLIYYILSLLENEIENRVLEKKFKLLFLRIKLSKSPQY